MNRAAAADRFGPTGRIYGVDLSAGMLRNARKLRERHHWANIHLTEGDAVGTHAMKWAKHPSLRKRPGRASRSAWPSLSRGLAAQPEREGRAAICSARRNPHQRGQLDAEP